MRSMLIAAAVTVVGCSTSEPDVSAARQVPEAARTDAAAVVLANNQFACDFYAAAGSEGNLVFSPFSITTALAMLDAGASGGTESEIRAALHADALGDHLHAGYHALIDSLDIGRGFGNYALSTADRLFGQTGFPFRSEYLATTRQHYDAELQPVDFGAAPESARDAINRWVAAQTAQAIPELFPAGSIEPTTVLALVNAIAFKGSWAQKFDDAATSDEPFQLADGTTVTVPMMHKSDTLASAPISDAGRLYDLPFAGGDVSLIVLVPTAASGLPAIEAQLSASAISQWIAAVRPGARSALVSFPRFTTRRSPELQTVLRKLGIIRVFNSTTADLSGIDGRTDLYVSAALHQAMLAVDEVGATAAAATGLGVTPVSLNLVTIDRPFVFLLYDHVTGAILFLGRIVNPTRG